MSIIHNKAQQKEKNFLSTFKRAESVTQQSNRKKKMKIRIIVIIRKANVSNIILSLFSNTLCKNFQKNMTLQKKLLMNEQQDDFSSIVFINFLGFLLVQFAIICGEST